jgi:hypothetical protein
MTNYIVDCRYVRTTTPVGLPDFTLEVDAVNESDANCAVAERASDDEDFVILSTKPTLDLIEELRSHVSILAQFGYEMACKTREATGDVAEFNALVAANGITVPGQDEEEGDEEEEEEDEDAWIEERLRDERRRRAKRAFQLYDFEAYGGAAEVCGWFGTEDEVRALIRLGGHAKPEHVLAVEFEHNSLDVIHVGVQPFEKVPMADMTWLDGSIIEHNRQT